jgi:protein TonB
MDIKPASKTKLMALLVSAVFHAALLFFVIFSAQEKAAELEETTFINLVNISEIKEEPQPVVVRHRVMEEASREIIPVQDETAETIIETDKELPAVETASAASVEARSTVPAASGPAVQAAVFSGEAASQYLKSNYNYIQRRVMRELVYPSQAKRTGLQGIVEIVFIINMDGTIRDAAVRKSSRHMILDEEALRAVQSSAPFRKPEAPIKIVIPVSFTLT